MYEPSDPLEKPKRPPRLLACGPEVEGPARRQSSHQLEVSTVPMIHGNIHRQEADPTRDDCQMFTTRPWADEVQVDVNCPRLGFMADDEVTQVPVDVRLKRLQP